MAWNPSATLAHMLLAPEVSNTCSCVVSWSNTQSYVKRFSVCCSALRVLRRLMVECSGATLSSSPVWPFLFSCGMKGRQRMHTRTFLKLVSPAVAPAAVIAAALRDAWRAEPPAPPRRSLFEAPLRGCTRGLGAAGGSTGR